MSSNPYSPPDTKAPLEEREHLLTPTGILRFWEIGRIPYNGILFAETVFIFQGIPKLADIAFGGIIVNALYCFGPFVDFYFLAIAHHPLPRILRYALYISGTILSAIAMLGLMAASAN